MAGETLTRSVIPAGAFTTYSEPMKRSWPFLVPGIILAAIGLVWTLQGTDVLGGSVMSGSSFWGIVGVVLLVVGLVLIVLGIVRRRPRRTG